MTIRWRLAVALLQIVALAVGTYVSTGVPWSNQAWYLAGLLAIVINRQLLEPRFPTPPDVVANSVIGLALYVTADRSLNPVAWHAVAAVLTATLFLSVSALLLGAGRRSGSPGARIGRAASLVSRKATASFVYSLVFFVSLLDHFSPGAEQFWILVFSWVAVVVMGAVPWHDVWSAASGAPATTQVQGLLGPSRLLISGVSLPDPGSSVTLSSDSSEGDGLVVTRILRPSDDWAEVHLQDPSTARRFLSARTVRLARRTDAESEVVGSVEKGSTQERLVFTTSTPLEIGMTVAVSGTDELNDPVLYQLSDAEVKESTVKGGSHLVVSASAHQVGRFDSSTGHLVSHRWAPPPGSTVMRFGPNTTEYTVPDGALLVGHVLGTDVPVFIDLAEMCEGHVAVLGMTKMGKTTLALRLARALADARRVVVVDQTGEYVNRRGLPVYDKDAPVASRGLSVLNMPDGQVGADFALAFVKKLSEVAAQEYASGEPHPRSVIFDEAHQFIPEPAGLGFNAPGRDSAFALGYQFMQVRKYGMSLALISQRTAVVAKGALSQCENLIVFKSVDRTGLEYLEQIAGPRVSRILPSLRQGEALLAGPAVLSDAPVVVRITNETSDDTANEEDENIHGQPTQWFVDDV